MIYLASPYSGTEEEQEDRYLQAANCCTALLKKGLFCISPIVHWHHPARLFSLGRDAALYRSYNHSLFTLCSSLYILQLEGWDRSEGVTLELLWAKEQEKRIRRVVPNGYVYHISDWT